MYVCMHACVHVSIYSVACICVYECIFIVIHANMVLRAHVSVYVGDDPKDKYSVACTCMYLYWLYMHICIYVLDILATT